MKKLIPFTIILLALSACDSPRSQRSVYGTSNGLSSGVLDGTTNDNKTTTDNTNTGNTTDTTSSATVPTDAKHCKFAADGVDGFESTSAHLGSYTLCQSSTDKNSFYFQLKTPPVGSNGDVAVCFIPHTSSGSNSIYIGNPMCGSFTNPKEIKKITFAKYAQYSNAMINSVMFFKDTSYFYGVPYNAYAMTLEAYKVCMARLAYPYYDNTYCSRFTSVGQYVMKKY